MHACYPPLDPFLQDRNRDLLVPDRTARKQLWRILGNPGALLADGEIAGSWRVKTLRTRLDITLEPFGPLEPGIEREIRTEAERVAAARGRRDVRVRVSH